MRAIAVKWSRTEIVAKAALRLYFAADRWRLTVGPPT